MSERTYADCRAEVRDDMLYCQQMGEALLSLIDACEKVGVGSPDHTAVDSPLDVAWVGPRGLLVVSSLDGAGCFFVGKKTSETIEEAVQMIRGATS